MVDPVGRNARGFPIWAQFDDRYDAEVRVITSSLAFEDCVWIFVTSEEDKNNHGAVHLTVEQAQTIRNALGAWIDHVNRGESHTARTLGFSIPDLTDAEINKFLDGQ